MAIKYANVRSEGILVIILEASKSVCILLKTRNHIQMYVSDTLLMTTKPVFGIATSTLKPNATHE